MIDKHDPDFLKAGSCSFYSSQGYATVYCGALKWHLEDLIRQGYLDEFILDSEEDPEVGEAPAETVYWNARSLTPPRMGRPPLDNMLPIRSDSTSKIV